MTSLLLFMYPFKSLVYLCGFTFYIFVEGSIMQVVPKRTDRNCYDRRYFTSFVRGIGIKFSISNNSTSLFGHWLKYCHCAIMYFETRHLTSNCELVGYCWEKGDTGKASFLLHFRTRYLFLIP